MSEGATALPKQQDIEDKEDAWQEKLRQFAVMYDVPEAHTDRVRRLNLRRADAWGVRGRKAAFQLKAEAVDAAGCGAAEAGCEGVDRQACQRQPEQLLRSCPVACGLCRRLRCADAGSAQDCERWAGGGECARNPSFMLVSCRRSCSGCLELHDPQPPRAVALRNGLLMPSVGYGTAGLMDDSARAVQEALQVGFRHLDTAAAREWYRQDLVAEGLAASGVARDEVFITSKIHPRDLGRGATAARVDAILQELRVEYVDLVLLHYAECWGTLCGGQQPQGTWRDSWKALEELLRAGRVLAIGVSNFSLQQLQELATEADIPPQVVQMRSDVFAPSAELQAWCIGNGVQFAAYSSLGTQWVMTGHARSPVLNSPTLGLIAARHNASAAQVALRWGLQHGQVVLPRSANRHRMADNLHLWGFSLPPDEMAILDALAGEPLNVAA